MLSTNKPTSDKLANRPMLIVNDDQDHVPMVKWYQKKTLFRLLLSGCIVAGVVGLKSLLSYCNRNRALLTISLDDGKLDPSKLQTFANEVLGLLALTKTNGVTEESIRQELNGLVLNATITEDSGARLLWVYLGESDVSNQAFMTLTLKMDAPSPQWELTNINIHKVNGITGSEVVELSDQVFTALNVKKVKLENEAHIQIARVDVDINFMKIVDNKTTTFYGARGYTCDGANEIEVKRLMESIYNYDIAKSPAMMKLLGDLGYSEFGPCMKKLYEKKEYKSFATIYNLMEADTYHGTNEDKFPLEWKKLISNF